MSNTANTGMAPDSTIVMTPHAGRIEIASGTLEGLKWLALASMSADHVNKAFFGADIAWLAAFGRLAMPLFVFVLAYNLARPSPHAISARLRTMQRLALCGMAALPFHSVITPLYGYLLPLNILFSLLLATAIIAFLERGDTRSQIAATVLFVAGGALVDYWWFGLAFCLASWRYCQMPTKARLAGLLASMAALCLLNGNAWALLALPLLLGAPHIRLGVPRLRHVFYVYYPLHLCLLFLSAYYFGFQS